MISRLLLSLAAGVAVAAIANLCAWRQIGSQLHGYAEHYLIDSDKYWFHDVLDEYKRIHRKYPSSLAELGARPDERSGRHEPPRDGDGRPLDPWETPYVYVPSAESYELKSLGRDSVEGGIGFDADILLGTDPNSRIEFPPPTFVQFVTDPASRGVEQGCIEAGLFAFIVGLVTIRGPTPFSTGRLIVLFVTVMMSIFIAAVLSALDIPSGH